MPLPSLHVALPFKLPPPLPIITCKKMPVPTMAEKLDSTSTDDAQPSSRPALEPLSSYTTEELETLGEAYSRKYDLGDIAAFRKGAVCAQSLERYRNYAALTEEERRILESEMNHKWHQPKLLYKVIMLCSICAAVQGMGKNCWLFQARTARSSC